MFGKYRLSVGRLFSDTLESGRLENIRENNSKSRDGSRRRGGGGGGGGGGLIEPCLWFGM